MEFIGLALLKLIGTLVAWMPHSLRMSLGWMLGIFLRVIGFRKKVIQGNIELAFHCLQGGEVTQKNLSEEKLLSRAYTHIGNLFIELFILFGPLKWFAKNHVEFRGVEHWRKARERGKGVIFLASHVGNWEMMAAGGGYHSGFPCTLVTKKLKPEWIHQAVERARATCGIAGAYEPKTMREITRALKKGETVGIILDQYAGPPIGVRVSFLGVPVGTSTLVATLARRWDCAVLPVLNYRLPNGKFVVDVREPLEVSTDPQASKQWQIARDTQTYVSKIEEDIRQYPEQWLWTHRRFKGDLSPVDEHEWDSGRPRPANKPAP